MWQILTKDDLLSRLSGPERDALDTAALDWAQESPLDAIVREVAEEWRGALRRATTLDRRPGAIPSEILIHILADVRYRAWTRLPAMTPFLDDRRVAEWQRAMAIRDALHRLSYEAPDPEHAEASGAVATPLPKVEVTHHGILD